ncbi:autotransporter domain-containing protein [Bosea sp. 685]|uniref:autotransporter domain-containing protein n=1 Tax=Bosea sp. 685 TaxID=3080057 RepID=UPI00289299EE|nr:autotransporter domain-containing protein [Bosea sp. 685]WNJ93546.1 autotransporter domain-containing protein [Bosea sp. 685]
MLATRVPAADVNVTSNVTTGINLDAQVGSTIEVSPGVSVTNTPLSVTVNATTSAWTLTNRGSISSVQSNAISLSFAGSSVSNFGTITANSFNGIVLSGGGGVSNAAGATITSGASGISIGTSSAGAGTVSNLGTITQTGTFGDLVVLRFGGSVANAQGATISANNTGNAVSVGQGASRTVQNAGIITNTGTNFATGVLVQGGASTVTNSATGRISGTFNGVYASASAPMTFTNDGLIESTSATGAARAVEATGGGTFVNTGTIRSVASDGLYLARAGTVTNRGTISGAVNAINFSGNYARTLNLDTGSVLNGNVQGGTGVDALVLLGSGTESAAKFQAFETLSMQGTAWQLNNAGAFLNSMTVQSGVLSVSGSLLSGATTVQANGTLAGTGTILSGVSNFGTLLGVQGQTLTMASLGLAPGSKINATLGAPGAQPLFNVTGALVLDGTLNISATSGFGAGVYRILSYSGSLTDNGLDIGAVPAGSTAANYTVQTAVAGQVNLISTAVLPSGPFNFWDGAAVGSANNGVIDGGSGIWSATAANWTDANGTVNRAMTPQPGFAIFQGQPGTVTVDGSAGAVSVTGMQFASSGYVVTGAPINLSAAQTAIRVGDGSIAGAGFVATIGSSLVGAGGLDKTDLGQLVLTAANTYTGATTISAGTLVANGSVASAVTINAGGVLGGSGSVGALTVNGILSPGNSPGTITVNGNLSFGATGIYVAEVQGSVSDRVNVTGTASLAGTVRLVPLGGVYAFNSPYTLLSAAGGRSGSFGTVDTTGSFGVGVTPTVSYTATDVLLTLSPAPLSPAVAVTTLGFSRPSNPASVARGIDRAVAAGADANPFFNLYNQTAAALPGAVNSLSGEVHTAANALGVEISDQFLRSMLDPFAPGRRAGVADKPGSANASPYAVWGSVLGRRSRTNGDPSGTGSATRDTESASFATGADYRLTRDSIIGFALAGGGANASLANGLGSADVGVFEAGIYGMTRFGDLQLGASGAYTFLDIDTKRTAPVLRPGTITASYHANGFSGRLEASYRVATLAGVAISPFAALQAQTFQTPAFVEDGGSAGPLGTLTSYRKSNLTTRSELGLKLEANTMLAGYQTTGFLRASWSQSFNREMAFAASLNGLAGSRFVIDGAKADRSALRLATGFDIKLRDDISLGGRIDSELAQNSVQYAGSIRLRMEF